MAYRYSTFEAAQAMIRYRPFEPFLAEVERLKRIAMETRERLDDPPGYPPPGPDEPGASR
ncbi:MAG: hypothetical protein O7A68_08890 [Alphaproteobacteria bacterium]|nr:hypothetical protein [Alphaproteobacteria bacterium]